MKLGVGPLRARRWLAVFPLAMAATALVHAAQNSFAIEDHGTSAAGAWTLSVDGNWPTQCTPSLKNVSIDGTDVRIDARSDLTLCPQGATPFAIELNPALAADKKLDPGIYHVSFYAADGTQGSPTLRAFTLVDRSAADAPTIAPEPGFWFTSSADTSSDRTVFNVELQDGQLSVALMTYDATGQAVWYFGAAEYAGHIAHIPLMHVVGGNDLFSVSNAAVARADAMMTMDVQFQSAAHALAWLSRENSANANASLQMQELDLVRMPLTDAASGQAWQGDWVLVADSDDAAPQKLKLANYRAVDAQHFEVTDASGANVLNCTREPTQPDWPPSSCSLRASNNLVGEFDSVALSRMDGLNSGGAAIHLLRITR